MREPLRSRHWPPRWPDISDRSVLRALIAVPRHLFVPPEYRDEAYDDIPLPIGHGQTISQPYIVALMTQALRLRPDSHVLEVGTGSGYQAAVIAEIAPDIRSVETVPELALAARERLRGLGYNVELKVGDGSLGWPEHAPYDAIIVTAAGPSAPPALALQLAEGGRLVVPVGQDPFNQVLWLITRGPGGDLDAVPLADVRFVPLVEMSQRSQGEDPALEDVRRELRRLLGQH